MENEICLQISEDFNEIHVWYLDSNSGLTDTERFKRFNNPGRGTETTVAEFQANRCQKGLDKNKVGNKETQGTHKENIGWQDTTEHNKLAKNRGKLGTIYREDN